MTDCNGRENPAPAAAIPQDLEARMAAFETAAPPADFDAASWLWMILLGVAIPLMLLAIGWWA